MSNDLSFTLQGYLRQYETILSPFERVSTGSTCLLAVVEAGDMSKPILANHALRDLHIQIAVT
jgi:hypothetical protein